MPEEVNPEERRAYEDGARDQKINDHGAHLERINGQIGVLATNTSENGRKLDRVLDEMPRVLSVAEEAEKAKIVADTLAKNTEAERSTWQRWQRTVGAVIASLVGLTVLATFALGLRDQGPPPTVTVTIPAPDISPR